MRRQYLKVLQLGLVMLLMFSGCSSSQPPATSSGLTSTENPPVLLKGEVVYDGKIEYLPRTVANSRFSGEELSIHYQHGVAQGLLDRYTNGVKAYAKLEVLKLGKMKCSYQATRSGMSGGFSPDTLTELRHSALLEVRNAIETNMLEDQMNGRLKSCVE